MVVQDELLECYESVGLDPSLVIENAHVVELDTGLVAPVEVGFNLMTASIGSCSADDKAEWLPVRTFPNNRGMQKGTTNPGDVKVRRDAGKKNRFGLGCSS